MQNETQGEKSGEKRERASVMCGTLSSSLMHVHLDSRTVGGGPVVAEEVFEEIMAENFPSNDENYNPIDFMNLGRRNIEKITVRHVLIQWLKTSYKEKS